MLWSASWKQTAGRNPTRPAQPTGTASHVAIHQQANAKAGGASGRCLCVTSIHELVMRARQRIGALRIASHQERGIGEALEIMGREQSGAVGERILHTRGAPCASSVRVARAIDGDQAVALGLVGLHDQQFNRPVCRLPTARLFLPPRAGVVQYWPRRDIAPLPA